MSQSDQIRAALMLGKSITPIDALQDYGCFRLAARIAELRAQGLNIKCKMQTKNGKRYASYKLRKPYGRPYVVA